MNPSLSVIIIAVNESNNIVECIKSASFADEILVMDSGSVDNTVALAKSMGARVIETNWPGYGPQQNNGIDASTGDWIFSLDADERITPSLATEIRTAITKAEFQVLDVPRRSLFVSRFMHHSGWWPDRTRRLFKRGSARFTDHEIHANLKAESLVGHLEEAIVHYSYHDFHAVIEKMNRYSSGSARDLFRIGQSSSLRKAIGHAIWAFIRTYFIRAGFMDGREGFMLSISNAEGVYYRYVKLMYLHERAKKQL